MATTNAQIIETYVRMNGIAEELHTYAAWKAKGYQVRKGEKSKDKITIWKHTSKKVQNQDGKEEERGRMFMTSAAFFRRSQVDKIE